LRRGQRLGTDEDGDDALALLLTNGVPAAHPRPSEVVSDPDTSADSPPGPEPDDETPAPAARSTGPDRSRDGRPSIMSRLSVAPRPQENGEDALKLHDGVSTETREITIVPRPLRPGPTGGNPQSPGGNAGLDELLGGGPRRTPGEAAGGTRDAEPPERQPSKPKRSSVPSWDEIVFGTRGD
jgi:hypothetical protein